MIATISFHADAVVTKKRARTQVPVDLLVRRDFVVPDVDPADAPVLVSSPVIGNIFGVRYDWRLHDGVWLRDVGSDAGPTDLTAEARERVETWRTIGLDYKELERRNRKYRDVVEEEDLREIHESNADEIASLLADWVAEEFVSVGGRLCVRERVPVLTARDVSAIFRYAHGDAAPDAGDFPVCLWDVPRSLLQKHANRWRDARMVEAADAWEPVAAPVFDRDNAFLVHHAAGICEKAKTPARMVLADMIRGPASNEDLIGQLRRIGAKETKDSRTFVGIARRYDPPRKTRYPLEGPADGTRIVFGLGHDEHERILVEARVPVLTSVEAPVIAVLSASGGKSPCVLRHAGDHHLVPMLDNQKVGDVPVVVPQSSKSDWIHEKDDPFWRMRSLAEDLGLISGRKPADDPAGCAKELAAFARDHLVDVGGVLHLRSGEPYLSFGGGSSVGMRPTRRGNPRASVDRDLSPKDSWTRNSTAAFGIMETRLMEAVATTVERHGKEEIGPVLRSVDVAQPDLFPLRTVHRTAHAMLAGVLERIPVESMPPRTARAAMSASSAVEAMGRRVASPPDAGTVERAHAAISAFVDEMSARGIHARIVASPEFAALENAVLPALAGSEPVPEDEEALSFGM